MSTSNSYDYTQNRDQVISDALSLIGVIGNGQTPNANDVTFCAGMLNKMLKTWEAQGIRVWGETEGTIALRTGINKYILSSGVTGDYAGMSANQTNLTVAGSGTGLTVTSTAGMTAADVIGIELDDNTRQWTTIVSVDSSTGLTITASLTGAASANNSIITYTTKLDRPLQITNARYYYGDGQTERPLVMFGRDRYMTLNNKLSEGACNAFYYSPQLSTGILYVWPTPTTAGDSINISYVRGIQDLDSASDNFDLPQEWLEPITYNLVIRIAPAFGIVLSKTNPDIIAIAERSLQELKMWDVGQGSIRIMPNYRG